MRIRVKEKVFHEIVFVFATVLIFRGLWTLMDRSSFFSSDEFLWFSVVLGVAISAVSLYFVHQCKK